MIASTKRALCFIFAIFICFLVVDEDVCKLLSLAVFKDDRVYKSGRVPHFSLFLFMICL